MVSTETSLHYDSDVTSLVRQTYETAERQLSSNGPRIIADAERTILQAVNVPTVPDIDEAFSDALKAVNTAQALAKLALLTDDSETWGRLLTNAHLYAESATMRLYEESYVGMPDSYAPRGGSEAGAVRHMDKLILQKKIGRFVDSLLRYEHPEATVAAPETVAKLGELAFITSPNAKTDVAQEYHAALKSFEAAWSGATLPSFTDAKIALLHETIQEIEAAQLHPEYPTEELVTQAKLALLEAQTLHDLASEHNFGTDEANKGTNSIAITILAKIIRKLEDIPRTDLPASRVSELDTDELTDIRQLLALADVLNKARHFRTLYQNELNNEATQPNTNSGSSSGPDAQSEDYRLMFEDNELDESGATRTLRHAYELFATAWRQEVSINREQKIFGLRDALQVIEGIQTNNTQPTTDATTLAKANLLTAQIRHDLASEGYFGRSTTTDDPNLTAIASSVELLNKLVLKLENESPVDLTILDIDNLATDKIVSIMYQYDLPKVLAKARYFRDLYQRELDIATAQRAAELAASSQEVPPLPHQSEQQLATV